ncbi:DUF4360 domain-containing protein [Massilia jejuensis]|uniref:DUF4360 domain-containing protein n=1 Tax=Massilia jejuensis TaxID=648894 RepID=A0ABW0PDH3_9BURK
MDSKTIVLLAGLTTLGLPAHAAQDGCPAGSYSVVVSPDRTTLSILFDKFNIDGNPSAGGRSVQSKACTISHPLDLPANMSLGVYKVDYRGFAKLDPAQQAYLEVQYALGPHGNGHGRVFRRKIKGAHEGDYFFTENIGAGQMKRAGCGMHARLDVKLSLTLSGSGEAMASLDSTDAKGAAMIYHLDLRKCN